MAPQEALPQGPALRGWRLCEAPRCLLGAALPLVPQTWGFAPVRAITQLEQGNQL